MTCADNVARPAYELQEVELLRSLSFDGNIVQFYGACVQEESIMMVLEFMRVSVLCPKPGDLFPSPLCRTYLSHSMTLSHTLQGFSAVHLEY